MRQFKKKGIFGLGVILVSIITFGLMVQSCQMEDDTLLLNENLEYSGYLDINVYNNTKAFTEHELKIITEAFMRIDKYLSEKNDIAFILVENSTSKCNFADKIGKFVFYRARRNDSPLL